MQVRYEIYYHVVGIVHLSSTRSSKFIEPEKLTQSKGRGMIQGTIRFHRGVFRLPLSVQLLVGTLVAFNMIAPLYFFSYLEAKVVLATFIVSAMLMFAMTGIFGFRRLLGTAHILWIPLLYFIFTRLHLHDTAESFGQWLRLLIAVNLFALIFDTIDFIRYLRGDKDEMVEGL